MTDVDELGINGVNVDLSADISMEDIVDGYQLEPLVLVVTLLLATDTSGRLVLTSLSGANIVTEGSDEQDMFAAGTQTNQVGEAVTEASHVITAYGSLALSTDGGVIDLEDGTTTAGDGLAKFGLQGEDGVNKLGLGSLLVQLQPPMAIDLD